LASYEVEKVDTEKDLLKRARNFDIETLGLIYDQYNAAIYRYAYRLLGTAEQAEDCVAETFSRFLKALKAGGGPSTHLRAYLYRVAHNWITDQYRRQPPPTLPLDTDRYIDDQPNPDQEMSQILEREQIRDALKLLTPDQRQVIILKYLEGWSNKEVAEALNKPVGAVKSLQHRAIASLQRILILDEDEL
jgi:RNA polymerase sigma-70 factor (ECF subfamily)